MKKQETPFVRTVFAFIAAVAATALGAAPVIDLQTVALTQNPHNRLVTVQYVLTGDPAVVTVDFQTNDVASATWASIGGGNFANIEGDVNKLVTDTGTTRTILWKPSKADAWPERKIAAGNFRAVIKAWATNAPPPYMIVDLQDDPGKTRYYASADNIPGGITNYLYKTTCLAMRLVRASCAQWWMGAPAAEIGVLNAFRETRHIVTFTNDWYMGVYPVTQKQNTFFASVGAGDGSVRVDALRPGPSTVTNVPGMTDTHPVETVAWTALRGFHVWKDPKPGRWPTDGRVVSTSSGIYKARQVTGIPSLDLPTEAMWEYTCRAGTDTGTYAGDPVSAEGTDAALGEIAWYKGNSGGLTHPVGLKKPNRWGFYDMLGNVNEWCLDQFSLYTDRSSPYFGKDGIMFADDVMNPPGPDQAEVEYTHRVVRGGSFMDEPASCRSACREGRRHGHSVDDQAPFPAQKSVGYRLCCDAVAIK